MNADFEQMLVNIAPAFLGALKDLYPVVVRMISLPAETRQQIVDDIMKTLDSVVVTDDRALADMADTEKMVQGKIDDIPTKPL